MVLSERHKKVLEAVAVQEAGKSPGFINVQDSEECESLGLIEIQGQGKYSLTNVGRRALASN